MIKPTDELPYWLTGDIELPEWLTDDVELPDWLEHPIPDTND